MDKFNQKKAQQAATMKATDKSRKGSVDVLVEPLITLINSMSDYFTTSSCSGRFLIFSHENKPALHDTDGYQEETDEEKKVNDEKDVNPQESLLTNKKVGCHWHFVSHSPVGVEKLVAELDNCKQQKLSSTTLMYARYEPFILHVQCRNLEAAQRLLHVALSLGLKNSGLQCNKRLDSFTLAIRSCDMMQFPILHGSTGLLLVTDSFLPVFVSLLKEMFNRSESRLKALYDAIQTSFHS